MSDGNNKGSSEATPGAASGQAKKAMASGKVNLPRWWRRRERPHFTVAGRLDKRTIPADRGRLQEVARLDRNRKLQDWVDTPEARRRKRWVAGLAVGVVVLVAILAGIITRKYGIAVSPQHQILHDLLVKAGVSYRMNMVALDGDRKSPMYVVRSREVSGLKGIPLPTLYIANPAVSNISALEGMPLVCLLLNHTQVSDIRALQGMPLEYLDMRSTRVTNVSVLAGMPLISVAFPTRPFPTGVEVLRPIPTLKLINKTKVDLFWMLFDRGLLPNQMDAVPFKPPPVPPPPTVARPRPQEPVVESPAPVERLPLDPDMELP